MITAKEQITIGLRAYSKALGVIKDNKMGKYFVVPIIANIVLMAVLLLSGSKLGDWVSSLFDNGEGWLGFAGSAVRVVMPIVFFLLFIMIGGSIVIMVMSPIYTTISEKTDTFVTGREFSTSAAQTAKDIWRTIVISLKNTVKQLFLTLMCLLLNFIPVIGNIVSVVLIFAINAYYFGYSFMDYTNERYRRNVAITGRVVSHYKYLAFTIGAVYALPMYMFCGTFIAAFLGGVSTVAATLAQMDIEQRDNEIHTIIAKY